MSWNKGNNTYLCLISPRQMFRNTALKRNAMPWIYKRESVYGTRVLVPSTQFTDYLFVSSKRVLSSSSCRRKFLGNCTQ